jgi:hypothetical protein
LPWFNITLSRFQAFRVLTLLPSCAFQLSSTHAETLLGGAAVSQLAVPLPPDEPPPLLVLAPAAPALTEPPPAFVPATLLPALPLLGAPPVLAPA